MLHVVGHCLHCMHQLQHRLQYCLPGNSAACCQRFLLVHRQPHICCKQVCIQDIIDPPQRRLKALPTSQHFGRLGMPPPAPIFKHRYFETRSYVAQQACRALPTRGLSQMQQCTHIDGRTSCTPPQQIFCKAYKAKLVASNMKSDRLT